MGEDQTFDLCIHDGRGWREVALPHLEAWVDREDFGESCGCWAG